MKKEDKSLKEIFKYLDVELEPPIGMKQEIYERLMYESNEFNFTSSTTLPWVSIKFFKFMFPVWLLVSILLTTFIPTIAF